MDIVKTSSQMRILSLNLWQQFGKWSDRRAIIIEGIQVYQPDVIAFHECIKTWDYDQVADLLGPEFNIKQSRTRDPSGMGISIASRWKLNDVQEIDLNVTPRTVGFPCTTLIADVDAPDPFGPFLFVNHFPNWQLNFEYERELQAVKAAQFIEARIALSTKQVVMVGDLDADYNSSSIRFFTGRQSLSNISICYRDAWDSIHPDNPGHTFTPENPLVKDGVVKGMYPFRDWPFRRIDYIFLRLGAHGGNALDITSCERIFDKPVNGIWASDHFGLIADFAMPPV
jgi:endonuclease/exonuclease/phosphatase family metal-dependent hydrolase